MKKKTAHPFLVFNSVVFIFSLSFAAAYFSVGPFYSPQKYRIPAGQSILNPNVDSCATAWAMFFKNFDIVDQFEFVESKSVKTIWDKYVLQSIPEENVKTVVRRVAELGLADNPGFSWMMQKKFLVNLANVMGGDESHPKHYAKLLQKLLRDEVLNEQQIKELILEIQNVTAARLEVVSGILGPRVKFQKTQSFYYRTKLYEVIKQMQTSDGFGIHANLSDKQARFVLEQMGGIVEKVGKQGDQYWDYKTGKFVTVAVDGEVYETTGIAMDDRVVDEFFLILKESPFPSSNDDWRLLGEYLGFANRAWTLNSRRKNILQVRYLFDTGLEEAPEIIQRFYRSNSIATYAQGRKLQNMVRSTIMTRLFNIHPHMSENPGGNFFQRIGKNLKNYIRSKRASKEARTLQEAHVFQVKRLEAEEEAIIADLQRMAKERGNHRLAAEIPNHFRNQKEIQKPLAKRYRREYMRMYYACRSATGSKEKDQALSEFKKLVIRYSLGATVASKLSLALFEEESPFSENFWKSLSLELFATVVNRLIEIRIVGGGSLGPMEMIKEYYKAGIKVDTVMLPVLYFYEEKAWPAGMSVLDNMRGTTRTSIYHDLYEQLKKDPQWRSRLIELEEVMQKHGFLEQAVASVHKFMGRDNALKWPAEFGLDEITADDLDNEEFQQFIMGLMHREFYHENTDVDSGYHLVDRFIFRRGMQLYSAPSNIIMAQTLFTGICMGGNTYPLKVLYISKLIMDNFLYYWQEKKWTRHKNQPTYR